MNNASNASSDQAILPGTLTLPGQVGIGLLLVSFVLVTIGGNALVVLAVLRERYMRANLTNRFLVSLALADLLMGGFVMPMAAVHTLRNGDWPFGRVCCDLWHASDVLSSTASILNLCSIAVERYWATQNPIRYASLSVRRRCTAMLTAVWIASLTISFPAIAYWRHTDRKRGFYSQKSVCRFTSDPAYLLTSSLVSFYVPLIVMIAVYIRIYQMTTKLIKSLKRGQKVDEYTGSQRRPNADYNINSPDNQRDSFHARDTERNVNTGMDRILKCFRMRKVGDVCDPRDADGQDNVFSCDSFKSLLPNCLNCFCCCKCSSSQMLKQSSFGMKESIHRLRNRPDNPIQQNEPLEYLEWRRLASRSPVARLNLKDNSLDPDQSKTKQLVSKFRVFATTSRLSKFMREQKAAKTLGLVMGLFICCWMPFFICNLLVAFCPWLIDSSQAFRMTHNIVTWLGYINSGINPFIYAHSMREFRHAFGQLICPGMKHRLEQRRKSKRRKHRKRARRDALERPGKTNAAVNQLAIRVEVGNWSNNDIDDIRVPRRVDDSTLPAVLNMGDRLPTASCVNSLQFVYSPQQPVSFTLLADCRLCASANLIERREQHRGIACEFPASLPSYCTLWVNCRDEGSTVMYRGQPCQCLAELAAAAANKSSSSSSGQGRARAAHRCLSGFRFASSDRCSRGKRRAVDGRVLTVPSLSHKRMTDKPCAVGNENTL